MVLESAEFSSGCVLHGIMESGSVSRALERLLLVREHMCERCKYDACIHMHVLDCSRCSWMCCDS